MVKTEHTENIQKPLNTNILRESYIVFLGKKKKERWEGTAAG